MASFELIRVVTILVVFGMVVVQLADEVEAEQQTVINRTKDNNIDLEERRGHKMAVLPYRRVLGVQRRRRTTKAAEEPHFAPFLSSIDQEKRARSSFRGDLGKRMMVLADALSPEDDLSTQVTWLPAGKRSKVSSRFRGDLGKRARSSFRGDLGKREEERAQEEQLQEEHDQQQDPQTLLMDDTLHQMMSPFLPSERGHDPSRYGPTYGDADDNAERNDDYDAARDRMTFGDMTATASTAAEGSRRWHQPSSRWRYT